ncbi:MAG: AsmA family protein [Hyphomicrobiales bacterium]
MRDLFVIIGSLLIAALLAAFAVPRFIDWTPYKGEIEARLDEATGLRLKLVGPIRLEFLPRLALDAEDVILDTKDARLSAARLNLEISLASLVGGEAHIVAAELDSGVIKLAETATDDPAATLIGFLQGGERPLRIDAIALRTIAITRAGADTPIATIERGDVALPAREGPLRLTAEGVFGGQSGRARLVIGLPEAEGRRRVSATFDAEGSAEARSWRLSFEGEAMKGSASPVALDGAVVMAQGDKGPPRPAPASENREAAQWRVQAKAHGEQRVLTFTEVEISRERAEALRLSGQGELDFKGMPRLSLDLSARRLLLDPLIEAPAPGASGGGARLGQALEALATGVATGLPGGLAVDFDIGSETVELAGESFEHFRVKGTASAQDLAVSSLNANWVGRGELSFSGGAPTGGAPPHGQIRGHVEVKAADAAAFLQGLDLASEAASARIPLTLAGDLTLAPEAARIEALDISLAGSKIGGSLTLTKAAGDRQARVDAELSSQDLDLEAWPLGAVTSVIPSSLSGWLRVHVERLRAGRGAGDVGRFDMSLSRSPDETLIDELKLQGYEGLTLSGSGAIGGAGSSFQAHIVAPKAAPLAALSRLVLPRGAVEALAARQAGLEPLSLTLSARRDATGQTYEVSLSGTAAATRLEAKGSFDAKGSLDALLAPISGEAVLSAPEAGALLAQLGLAIGPGEPLGRGELKLAMKPDAAGALTATANLAAGQATLSGDGTLSFSGAPQGHLQGHGGFSASTPSLAAAMRILGFAPRLDGDQRFEISGGWTLSSEDLALERLNARFLGKALTGALNLSLGGQRRLTGQVFASDLFVPGLASMALGPVRMQAGQGPPSPPSTATPSAAATSAAASWASTRFPAFMPPPLPVSLDIAAPFADLGAGIAARDAKLTLELGERGIAMMNASATLAGGQLSGDWRIERDGGLARSVMRLSADGVALKGLAPAASFTGKLSGRLELAGAGETLAQIVASSGGGGTLRVADGALDRAEIAGLQRSFAKAVIDDALMEKARLATLVAAETARGPLSGIKFEAPLVAANGVLKTTIPRQELASDDAADGAATIDLKSIALDARLGLSTLSAGRPENRVPLAATIMWKGPLFAPKREVDAGPLLQAVSIERLRLELERIELLEYDQREQAMFNRFLKSFRQKPLPLPAPSPLPSPPSPDQPATPPAPQPETLPPKAN